MATCVSKMGLVAHPERLFTVIDCWSGPQPDIAAVTVPLCTIVPPRLLTPDGPVTFPPPPEKLHEALLYPGPVTLRLTLDARVTVPGLHDSVGAASVVLFFVSSAQKAALCSASCSRTVSVAG